VIHLGLQDRRPSRAIGWQLAVVSGALAGVYLWPESLIRLSLDEPVGAAAMAILPLGFLGVTYFNARYWLARVELERPIAVGWLPVSGAAAALIVSGCAVGWSQRDPGGGFALDGDRSVLLVTIEGVDLRAAAELPTLSALGDSGILFSNAVTPSPASGAGNASILTGLHPLRHRLLFDDDPLLLGLPTLSAILAREGYATGGFVSGRAVRSALGFSQGFGTFDDDFSPVPGAMHIRLIANAIDAAVAAAAAPSFLRERTAKRTTDRFLSWHASVIDETWFGWVNLGGSPTEIDTALARLLERLEYAGTADDTLIIVAGTFGTVQATGLPGALADDAVRVPLIVRAPGEPEAATVDAQVRLMDVSATVLDHLELDAIGASEGVPLIPYARGERRGTMWTALVWGQPDDVWFGMRNNGVKFVERGDFIGLWNVEQDPDEMRDLIEYQADTLESAQRLLASERVALQRLLDDR
jgi:hypothetical protein